MFFFGIVEKKRKIKETALENTRRNVNLCRKHEDEKGWKLTSLQGSFTYFGFSNAQQEKCQTQYFLTNIYYKNKLNRVVFLYTTLMTFSLFTLLFGNIRIVNFFI